MGTSITVISKPSNKITISSTSKQIVTGANITATQLSKLTDVDATTPQNNETLVYDSATGKYVVKELPIVNGGTF